MSKMPANWKLTQAIEKAHAKLTSRTFSPKRVSRTSGTKKTVSLGGNYRKKPITLPKTPWENE